MEAFSFFLCVFNSITCEQKKKENFKDVCMVYRIIIISSEAETIRIERIMR